MLCSVMLEAISKLLETTPTRKDVAPPSTSKGLGTVPRGGLHNLNYTPPFLIEVGMSREGMWMLSHYCTPTTKVGVRMCVHMCVCNVCMYVV